MEREKDYNASKEADISESLESDKTYIITYTLFYRIIYKIIKNIYDEEKICECEKVNSSVVGNR